MNMKQHMVDIFVHTDTGVLVLVCGPGESHKAQMTDTPGSGERLLFPALSWKTLHLPLPQQI